MTADNDVTGAPTIDDLDVPDVLRPFAEIHLRGPDPLRRIAEALHLPPIVEAAGPAALARCAAALRRAAPGDRMVWALTDTQLASRIPDWHWRMVNDLPRNDAYQKAIEASVRPGMLVLEIGAGTGLLAMMAARAGAGHVYTIETDPRLALVARRCIAENGYSEKITILEMHSRAVSIPEHLPRRCDLLIQEILSTNVLGEGVIPSVADARRDLLLPDAPLLPQEVWATGALGIDDGRRHRQAGLISGFDLSALNILAPSQAASGRARPELWLSEPQRLLSFALDRTPRDWRGSAQLDLTATAAGEAAGIVQWLGLGFPCGHSFESLNDKSSWGTFLHPFDAPVQVSPGDRIGIRADFLPELLSFSLRTAHDS